MASESASASATTGVGSTSAPKIRELNINQSKPSDLERLQPLHNDRQLAKSSMQALLLFLIGRFQHDIDESYRASALFLERKRNNVSRSIPPHGPSEYNSVAKASSDHLDAKERKQDKCPLETPLDFEEGVFDDEIAELKDKKDKIPETLLSGTFADLPAPETEWEEMAPAPVPRLDGASIQINELFYVFSGYRTLDQVHSHVDVYNFTSNQWGQSFATPKQMANSHLGMATDGRYIYVVSGQQGPQCRTPPVAETFVLDTQTRNWDSFPPLPEPRYAPATQLWRGRLHVMGGGKENRHTPSTDHWSIAVKNGKALEKTWRKEVPIPRGGPHSYPGCLNPSKYFVLTELVLLLVNGFMLLVGSKRRGDFMPNQFSRSSSVHWASRHEVIYGDVYMLDDKMEWHKMPPLPKPDSHIEASWVLLNNSIVIAGGTTEKNPVTKRMILVGELFRFDLDSLKWHVIGKLPYRVKTTQAAYWNGWFYITSGQRDKGPDNPQPKKVVADLWRTKLSL
ncbi:Kelch repeat-containing protein-like protein [Tanacetum coccineum]|uniref:Kelch repeat-containing protein-like protein n=1 Tax=Tanacetum coccineum TaxID=301880 RepID=A0ABQ5IUV0_9ASTR